MLSLINTNWTPHQNYLIKSATKLYMFIWSLHSYTCEQGLKGFTPTFLLSTGLGLPYRTKSITDSFVSFMYP